MPSEIHHLSISDVARSIRSRELSPVGVVDACLARIDARNARLHAFITVLAEQAREQAREADLEIAGGRWRGPLHGVPIGVKDFYDTAGVRTTAAFEPFVNRVPARDADVVAGCKAAGAIVIGKTNMHRLGMGTTGLDSYFGPARNPIDERYIPGGSSSGSAAAVADGLCFATLDTDAIGSCRLPAACCGVVGFKPTFGAISANGILAGEPVDDTIQWFSHPAITARHVRDANIVFAALTGGEWHSDEPLRVRVGVVDNCRVDDEVKHAFEAAVNAIASLGYETTPSHAPFDMPRFGDLRTIEADRQTIAARVFKDIDALVLPTTTTVVPTVEQAEGHPHALSAANTMFANYFGLPAISIPGGVDARGLPIGFQIVGRPGEDHTVLSLGRECESRAPHTFSRSVKTS